MGWVPLFHRVNGLWATSDKGNDLGKAHVDHDAWLDCSKVRPLPAREVLEIHLIGSEEQRSVECRNLHPLQPGSF